jgi:hypothetical protein
MAKFTTPLHQLCGNKKIVDHTHYIHFKGEYLYVSNGNVAIKQHLSLHGFTEREMRQLDNKNIHKDVFKLMYKNKLKFNISNIDVFINEKSETYFRVYPREYYIVDGSKKLVEQIDKSFDSFRMNESKEIAMNPDYITLLRKVMVTDSSGFTFRFNEGTGGVLVTPNKNNYKEHAMIVPLVITGELC